MDAKDLKKYLAGLGIASLLTGGVVIAADKPAEEKAKSAPTSTLTSEPTKTAPAKSG